MSTEQASGDAAPYVQLFQKAHQKIVTLERLDEQFHQLIIKRQELQDELRSIQSQLNEEFDLRIRSVGEDHARPAGTIAPDRPRIAARFGGQTIDSVTMEDERAVG